MRYPKNIKGGDTIGFVAPAFGCSFEPYKSTFQSAQGKFKAKGYNISLGPNCYKDDGVGISTSPDACASELTEYYVSDDVDALISCGGGELMCETISFVDFDRINAAKPKWYMGYSDNTNFTFLLTTLCDVASIYGPNAPKFGMDEWHESLDDAMAVLEGKSLKAYSYDKWELESLKDEENPLVPFNLTMDTIISGFDVDANDRMVSSDNVSMSGRLIGGCVDCLVTLLGTRFDKVGEFLERYKEDGFIWFIECCDLNVFSMRRAMWQMYEAGWFKYCKGFLIGRPMHYDEPMFGLDRFSAMLDTIEKLKVPAIMDVDIGHLSPSMPIICGSIGHATLEDGKVTVDMELK